MRAHFTHKSFLNPPHRITIDLIGAGGTGSQVLTSLGRLHATLILLGHPGIFVRCWDDDIVDTANMGRQLFSAADLYINKSVVLISRLNAFFGTDWQAKPYKFDPKSFSNITITCVDSIVARIQISKLLKAKKGLHFSDTPFYWLDMGNGHKHGQIVLGTVQAIGQPVSEQFQTVRSMPHVIKKFPELKKMKDEESGPSCSLAEAIGKQDLFINSIIAQFGVNLLWKLFREGMITHHGAYVNLNTMIVNPIKI